jgi:hypothetical protein
MSTRYTVEENSDGTAIVKLAEPVQFQGAPLSRLTIPRITGKHMRNADWQYGHQNFSIGQVVRFANAVVLPAGVIDELDAALATELAVEVVLHMGKASRVTGAEPSSTSPS